MTYHIEGRRWFQRTYGNTYNTVYIYKNGECVAKLPKAYGYGDYYLQRAHEWLGENGHPELSERRGNGSPTIPTWQWLRDNNSSHSVIDVERQRDL